MTPPTEPSEDAAEVLVDAVQRLSAARSVGDVTAVVRSAARRVAGADGATFVLRDGDKCHYADEDAIAPLWKGKRFPMSACISGWVMLNHQPTLIPDIYADPRLPHDAYRPTFVKSLAMVPIRSLGPVGAIGAYWATAAAPTPTVVRWLQSLADASALALELVSTRAEARAADGTATLLRGEVTRLKEAVTAGRPAAGDLVRMCFLTKRFEVGGRWVSAEELVEGWCGVQVSHGLSPEGLSQMAAGRSRQTVAAGCLTRPGR
jgi:GAF domain-containing protein